MHEEPRPGATLIGVPALRHGRAAAALPKFWVPEAMVCLALSLSGCAAHAPPHAPDLPLAVPLTWSRDAARDGSGPSSLVQWWLRFHGRQLQGLITLALQANTSVLTAEAALRQSRAVRDLASAALKPKVVSTASAQHATGAADSAADSFKLGLDASWELDIFGFNRYALDASTATVRASAASLGDVQVSIAAEVALDYIALRSAQARLRIAQDNLNSQQETLQITQWRQQAGLVTALEVEQARAAVAQTSAQLPPLQTVIAQTQHALATLIGQVPQSLLSQLAPAMPVPQVAQGLVLAIPAETLRQRPDVRAAERQVVASLARLSQAEVARLPDFRLGGSWGASAATLGGLSNGATLATSLLASMTFALFDGGALRAQVRVQQAALDQVGLAYKARVLAALRDVEDALVALQSDRERLQRQQLAAQAASNAARMARQRFSSGLVDFQVVLETQRSQFNTQDRVASAHADVVSDHVRLYKALGGGWNADASDAASEAPPNNH